jgi:hypothetical protein
MTNAIDPIAAERRPLVTDGLSVAVSMVHGLGLLTLHSLADPVDPDVAEWWAQEVEATSRDWMVTRNGQKWMLQWAVKGMEVQP